MEKYLLKLLLVILGIFFLSCREAAIEIPQQTNTDPSSTVETPPNFSSPGGIPSVEFLKGSSSKKIYLNNVGGAVEKCDIELASLPEGLKIMMIADTCAITGTPVEEYPKKLFKVVGSNYGGSQSDEYFINLSVSAGVESAKKAPEFDYPSVPEAVFRKNEVALFSFKNTGGKVGTCTGTPTLPSGLTLAAESDTCAIKGTPTQAVERTSYQITGSDLNGTLSDTIQIYITVKPVDAPVLADESSPQIYFVETPPARSFRFKNSGGTAASCEVQNGATLPAGLALRVESGTCAIYGTPTQVMAASIYTVAATNETGTNSATVSIAVNAAGQAPVLSALTSTPVFRKNEVIGSIRFPNTGGAIKTCSVSPIFPTGISLNAIAGTCEIGGTPVVQSSKQTYTITAENDDGSAAQNIDFEVLGVQPPALSTSKSEWILYTESAETIDLLNAGGKVENCVTNPRLPEGLNLTLFTGSCRISGTPSAASAKSEYTVTAQNEGGSSQAKLSIQVQDLSISNPPKFDALSRTIEFTAGKTSSHKFKNTGGKPEHCNVTPELPSGVNILKTFDSCLLSASGSQTETDETDFKLAGGNPGGTGEVSFKLKIVPKTEVNSPPVFSESYASGTHFKEVELEPITFSATSSGGKIETCSVTSNNLPNGLNIEVFDAGCRIVGTPGSSVKAGEAITLKIQGSNSHVEATAGVNPAETEYAMTLKESGGKKPELNLVGGAERTYIKNRAINTLAFNNVGGAATECSMSGNLPAGLYITLSAGTCAIKGVPTETTNKLAVTVIATNSLGNSQRSVNITVQEASEESAEGFLAPTIKYLPANYSLNQEISVSMGKYYGKDLGRFLNLYVYGPYSSADNVTVDFANDTPNIISVSVDTSSVPLGSWFRSVSFSLADKGHYRLFAGFCIQSSSKLNVPRECKYSNSNAKTIVVSDSASTGGGTTGGGTTGGGSTGGATGGTSSAGIEELKKKTAKELLELESGLKSPRLITAIENLETRPVSALEGSNGLEGLLGDDKDVNQISLTHGGKVDNFTDVRRVIRIFAARYDKLNSTDTNSDFFFGEADTEYKKARLAWEWLFPLRNGHIKEYPHLYNTEVSSGAKYPYTFKNFLIATALYTKFCGDSVGGKNPDVSEANLTLLCTYSMTEMFAHFTQEVGAHIGSNSSVYSAPNNRTLITAAKSGDAGGMKEFSCSNQYASLNMCKIGESIPEWRQGFYFVNEAGCSISGSGCEYRECTAGTWQADAWPCPDGVKYFGRGAKQLSYNYNYGPFSQVIFGTVTTLLNDPNRVTEGWLAIASAVYFFMQPRPPKPSMFERTYGYWTLPDNLTGERNLNLSGRNFSGSIMIINGGIECGGSKPKAQASNRVKYYMGYMDFFDLQGKIGHPQDSDAMSCANTEAFDQKHGATYDSYWTVQTWKGGCFLVSYETAFSGFIPGDYEKCIRSL